MHSILYGAYQDWVSAASKGVLGPYFFRSFRSGLSTWRAL